MRVVSPIRRRVQDDEGMTVVEVLVTMVISTVLLAAISAMVINGIRTADAANQRTNATAEMRTAADRMTKQLRTADSYDGSTKAIIVAEAERIGFYAKLDTLDLAAAGVGSTAQVPSVIWLWSRDGTDTTQEICQQVYRGTQSGTSFTFPAGATDPAATRTCQVLARGLSRTPIRPMFTYLTTADTTYRADGSSVSTIAVDAAGTVPGTDIASIQSVELWMTSAMRTQEATRNHSTVARVTFINLTARS